MKTHKSFGLGLVFVLLATLGGVGDISAASSPSLPIVQGEMAPPGAALAPGAEGPIIVDHTAVDQYDDIPQEYTDKVKKMWLNVPGESHSAGYRNGLLYLEDIDSRFQVNVTEPEGERVPPEPCTDQHLRVSRITWGAYGWNPWGYGEADWYTNAEAIAKTKNHLDYCNTHDLQIAAIGFGWCWDMTWHNPPTGTIDSVYQVRWAGSSEDGPDGDKAWGLDAGDIPLVGNRVTMDTYLSATQQYVEHALAQGYTTTVFFTTGPVDGSAGESCYQRHLKHEHIRDYVRNSSNLVLFDYADILSWSDAGQQNLQSWTDYGGVSRQYQMIHPDNMQDFDPPYGDPSGDDHIGEYGALRLGKALWWMLARLAGWDGRASQGPNLVPSYKAASRSSARQGERITYTIVVRNQTGPLTVTVALTDTVPTGLAYVPDTLQATAGDADDSNPAVLRWSGVLSPTPAVTLTYMVTVTAVEAQPITNTVTIAAPGSEPIVCSETIVVNGPPAQPDLSSSTKQANRWTAEPGETLYYTLRLVNTGDPFTTTTRLTDTVPAGLAYIPGTLEATRGEVDASAAPTLLWSGAFSSTQLVTVTYAVTVAYGIGSGSFVFPRAITNTALIAAPGQQAIARAATITVVSNAYKVYLPLVLSEAGETFAD